MKRRRRARLVMLKAVLLTRQDLTFGELCERHGWKLNTFRDAIAKHWQTGVLPTEGTTYFEIIQALNELCHDSTPDSGNGELHHTDDRIVKQAINQ